MTGRQLQRRPGYDIDIEKVLRACARYGVAVEINAHPWRLELDWRWPSRTQIRLHDEHQSGRPLNSRTRPHAPGRRDGAEGWACRQIAS
jgi:histidinol phosphatase-like PHP family hydrolase